MFFRENEAESIQRVEKAIEEIKKGKMVILTDNEDRENEGDLVLAAELVTPEAINFMAKYGRGLICLTMLEKQINRLSLPMMVAENHSPYNTAFTISIEAREGVTTGISAADRARTIKCAIDPKSTARDIISPGHVFPLKARDGGVLVRTGQTEGSMDLARLAGLNPAGVICEIMNDDGTMARSDDLDKFCEIHNIMKLSIVDLIIYRLHKEPLISEVSSGVTKFKVKGELVDLNTSVFSSPIENLELFSISIGEINPDQPTLVRMHHSCPLSDVFRIGECNCGNILEKSIEMIVEEGVGAIIYIESGESSLSTCFSRHILKNFDENEFNGKRNYGLGAQVLKKLGVGKIRLITNHNYKIKGIRPYGLEISERVAIEL